MNIVFRSEAYDPHYHIPCTVRFDPAGMQYAGNMAQAIIDAANAVPEVIIHFDAMTASRRRPITQLNGRPC